MATAIDTLKIYERLKNADLSDKAAKEIAEVVREATGSSSEETKQELTKEFATKADLLLVEARLSGKIEAQIADTKAELLKWMFIFWASQIGIIVALIKFLK
ncbi:MAG: hypothetical protein H7844_02365 [Nitrospirae bacterium YQR-1]